MFMYVGCIHIYIYIYTYIEGRPRLRLPAAEAPRPGARPGPRGQRLHLIATLPYVYYQKTVSGQPNPWKRYCEGKYCDGN